MSASDQSGDLEQQTQDSNGSSPHSPSGSQSPRSATSTSNHHPPSHSLHDNESSSHVASSPSQRIAPSPDSVSVTNSTSHADNVEISSGDIKPSFDSFQSTAAAYFANQMRYRLHPKFVKLEDPEVVAQTEMDVSDDDEPGPSGQNQLNYPGISKRVCKEWSKLKAGEFIQITYRVGKKTQSYVGLVVPSSVPLCENRVTVKFLKSLGHCHVFPLTEKTTVISPQDVDTLKVLPNRPQIDSRGRHFFNKYL